MHKFFKKVLSFFVEMEEYSTTSELNGDIDVSWIDGRKTLNVGEANYSFGALHDVFKEAFQKIEIHKYNFKNVLILGYAAGSAAVLLRKNNNFQGVIHGVELDKDIINIAEEHFPEGIDAANEIFIEDAFLYVQKCTQQYDLIIVDLYLDVNIPEHFEKEVFIKNVKSICSSSGMVIFNKIASTIPQKYQAQRLLSVLQDNFPEVVSIELTNCPENRMFVVKLQ